MANVIKTKFSAVTAQPSSLAVGELAYSDTSDTLWIGDNTGTPVAIGGAAAFTKLAGIEAGAEVNDVLTVAGRTGNVVIAISDLSGLQTALDGKASTSHSHAISDVTGLQTALDLKATLASPTFTGSVTVPTPSATTDAATKGYVDSVALGLDFKQSVVCASTANVDIASALENGDTIDGVTLATGNRVLLKNQTSALENGIYVVVASGAASRSTDADTSGEVTKGLFAYVESGTANGGTAWVVTSAGALDTDAVTFTQFGGGASYSAGSGLTLTGTVFALDNHSAALLTSGTLDVARLPSTVVLDTETIDGGSF